MRTHTLPQLALFGGSILLCYGQAPQPCGPGNYSCGCIVNTYKGINAQYNMAEYDSSCEPEVKSGPLAGTYPFACPEFIRRFYTQAKGVNTTGWVNPGNGVDYYPRAAAFGLVSSTNCISGPAPGTVGTTCLPSTLPQPDDIISFCNLVSTECNNASNAFGHVAIVRDPAPVIDPVTGKFTVTLIEQNWALNGTHTLNGIRNPEGAYTIFDRPASSTNPTGGSYYRIQGWMRLPSISVNALLNGLPWPSSATGEVSYFIAGPNGTIIGQAVPASYSNLAQGNYTLSYDSGGPAQLVEILPEVTQYLSSGGALTFTFGFSSEICAGPRSSETDSIAKSSGGSCPLVGSCSIWPYPLPLGQGGTVTAQGYAGVPPYQYQMAPGLPFSSVDTIGVLPSMLGTFTYSSIQIKDSTGAVAPASCSVPVVVGTPALASLVPDRQPVEGQPFNLIINGSGFAPGIAVFLCPLQGTCQNPVVNVLSSTELYLPNVQWNGVGTVNVHAVNVGNLSSNTLSFTVSPPTLTGHCTVNGQANPITLEVGQQATFVANTSGGTSPLNYVWTGIAGNDSSSASQIYTNPGVYNVSVTVSDSGSPQQQLPLGCPQVTVSKPPPISAFCNFNPSTITLGQGSTIYAGAIGGYPPYQFLLPGSGTYGSVNSEIIIPNNAGNLSYQVTAKDTQNQTNAASCSIQVNGVAPTITGYSWNSAPRNRMPFSGVVVGSGFLPVPLTQVWFCVTGSSQCFQQPEPLITVNGLTMLTVTNANLTTGSWQVKVVTPYGSVVSNTSFSVGP